MTVVGWKKEVGWRRAGALRPATEERAHKWAVLLNKTRERARLFTGQEARLFVVMGHLLRVEYTAHFYGVEGSKTAHICRYIYREREREYR